MSAHAGNDPGMADPTRLTPTRSRKTAVQVVIESPKGSRNKYAFDPKQRVFKLKKLLPNGMVFPYDFGFIPQTQAADGDPIDVLVLMDEPAFVGCVLDARLIGVIQGMTSEAGSPGVRNDRLIAVAEESTIYANVHTLSDLGRLRLEEIEHFLVQSHLHDGMKYRVQAREDRKRAMQLILRARANGGES